MYRTLDLKIKKIFLYFQNLFLTHIQINLISIKGIKYFNIEIIDQPGPDQSIKWAGLSGTGIKIYKKGRD